ncbi:unnamed protein product [Rotaria sordida]|uniref:Uncharacterized protein n=1 Tax=Rotaria sordida TaxID=392033 RepID=A0A815MFM9_9BILA|nr:unnamed protein product [Rotaria sordida]CAF1422272.1 unnamed protein product [Rotaria sordida]
MSAASEPKSVVSYGMLVASKEVAKCVQTQLNIEYSKRAFKTIENSNEIEQLSSGLGCLLVVQARSILTMKSIVEKLNEDLEKHLKTLLVPFASPVSFRASFSSQPFQNDYELNRNDLKLYEDPSSKKQTFISRLVAFCNHVRRSRQKFEQTPDRDKIKIAIIEKIY